MAGQSLNADSLGCQFSPVAHTAMHNHAGPAIVSRQLGRAFPVRAGVPVMLLDEARELSEAEIGALRK